MKLLGKDVPAAPKELDPNADKLPAGAHAWEYKTVLFAGNGDLDATFNAMGKNGWEAWQMEQVDPALVGGRQGMLRVAFKRYKSALVTL